MNTTIVAMISLVIGVIFFGMAFYYATNVLHTPAESRIKDFRIILDSDTIIITLQTTESMQGKAVYFVGADSGTIRFSDFDTNHRLTFDGSGHSGERFQTYVEICDVNGICETSETIEVII